MPFIEEKKTPNTRRVAVSIKNVSKDFHLPHEKTNSLKSIIIHPFQRRSTAETQHALKDISFEIKEGEFFGIVGRNGSGKSTLLKIIAGIYQPTKGEVKVNGRLVPFIELGVGFNPELTGRENVYLNGGLMGFSEQEVKMKYKEIVEFAELERFMDQKLKNYSSGMQVRLAFSVATILADSDILLVDEVLAVGDTEFQRKCFDYFRSLKKKKKTVIFVSHDMGAVAEYCDRAVLIEKSEIVKSGPSLRVAEAYTKMFIKKSNSTEGSDSDESLRWGDKSLVFGEPRISHELVDDSVETIRVTVDVEVKMDTESPLFGFSIKVPTGGNLMGTNNNIVQNRIKSLKAGDRVSLQWNVPNVFSEGEHEVDLAAEYGGGVNVADRWEGALKFTVKKIENTPYVISPKITLKTEILNGKK